MRIANLLAVTLPLAGLVLAIVFLWGWGFSWVHLGLMIGMYLVTGLGITIGFHRLFTHKSFDTPRPVAAVIAVMGSMAMQGPILKWAATHRAHHRHSDTQDDPHSPHSFGSGLWAMVRGIWHAHLGWIFERSAADLHRYIPDLTADRVLVWISRLFPLWVVLGLAIPALLGGLITMSWMGALLGFLWGGLVRVFLVHHVTWSINSVCHIWGSRPFKSHDHSRNNPIFGVLAFGEGWHNNHHAFPASARHGLRWWEFDSSYWLIRGMALVGLASNIRLPNAERIESKRRGG
jgi:stearoyl-CoA desaturase (delta-9 desaturase)